LSLALWYMDTGVLTSRGEVILSVEGWEEATRQRVANRLKRLPAHQDRMTHGHLFEPSLLTAKTPGDLVILANDPIPGHRSDCFHSGGNCQFPVSVASGRGGDLNRDRRFDGRIRIVARQFDIFVLKIL